jgi:hypothetical protein
MPRAASDCSTLDAQDLAAIGARADALLGEGDLDRALARYRRAHGRRLGLHHFLIADYSTGRRFNPLERLFFSAGARDPQTAFHFGKFGARLIGVPAFVSPAAIGRALFVNAKWHLPRIGHRRASGVEAERILGR